MPSYPPRAMRAEMAARYLDMEADEFLKAVDRGYLPRGFVIPQCDGYVRWDRIDLDGAIDEAKEQHDSSA